ncbi:Asp-tRNA(Asn)/Glu-tRNA(Gln) amidotransferase subunit GatC [Candidatus Parvarchaeota archaeon]|nr:Asp-tRNA(Asn)/Glu-tRNA(Gln) amidotransferase subunit GatC [Candidatus Parvarchaeota archaeon]
MEKSEFERLLKICRLDLDKKEKDRLKDDTEEILKYFDQISKVDTHDLRPAFHPIELQGQTRKDKVIRFDKSERLLKNTKTHRFFVLGPKV